MLIIYCVLLCILIIVNYCSKGMNHAILQGKPEILRRCTENAVTKEQTIVDKQNI